MDWKTGYLRQAKSDYALFLRLGTLDDVPLCHRLRYLQMATEKLAKFYLAPSDGTAFRNTHRIFADFVHVAKGMTGIRRQLRMETHHVAYLAFLRAVEPLALQVQNLSPEGDHRPNPEYPWQDDTGQVLSPLDYPFSDLQPTRNVNLQKLLRFIEACLRKAGGG